MRSDPYESKAQFDQEAAEYAFMEDTAAVMDAQTEVRLTAKGMDAADRFDAELIADARALAGLDSHAARQAYLSAHGSRWAQDDGVTRAAVMGAMQAALSSLASGYERELKRAAELEAELARVSRGQLVNALTWVRVNEAAIYERAIDYAARYTTDAGDDRA